MKKNIKNVVLHAPNIRAGGGLTLLLEVLLVLKLSVRWMQLNEQLKNDLRLPQNTATYFVNYSVISRALAEWRLWLTAKKSDVILCFHGLPPLLPSRGQVVVFVQNRILFESTSLAGYPFLTRTRLSIERLWIRVLRGNAHRYIVQTPSMANSLKNCLGSDLNVSVFSFAPLCTFDEKIVPLKKYDFVYVASGDLHKNHHNLLEAWRLLACAGFRPFLALTINFDYFPFLCIEIARYKQDYGLNIFNLGQLPMADIPNLYLSSSALIFPSKIESFGLPLIEATQLGLPVLASELDYVRDLIEPKETFDPNSPVSISRAVRRFLGYTESVIQLRSAEEFLEEVLK